MPSSTTASVPTSGEGKKGSGGKKKSKGRSRQQGDKPVNAPPAPSVIHPPKHAAPQLPIPTAGGGGGGERRGASHGTVAKERAKADAIFASTSSHWYAGAAFDRSPAASTLPKPTRLLSRSPTRMLPPPQLATSCPSSSASSASQHYLVGRPPLPAGGVKTEAGRPLSTVTSPGQGESQTKSRDLLSMLRSAQPTTASAAPLDPAIAHVTPRKPSPPSPSAAGRQDDDSNGARQRQELDEMTRQVRRLLNIS